MVAFLKISGKFGRNFQKIPGIAFLVLGKYQKIQYPLTNTVAGEACAFKVFSVFFLIVLNACSIDYGNYSYHALASHNYLRTCA